MQEIELKFQIPAESLAALSADIERLPGHDRERLLAHYVDTPDRRLGKARSALRVRKEGERWVQTLKAAGANTMIRLEDNQAAPPPPEGQAARVNLGLHRGTPAEASLARTLGWDPEQDPEGVHTGLVELYRTDIWRHSARLAVDPGSPLAGVVELALDIGHIHAGPLSVPVRELEIELVQGHPMAVLHCARDWVTNHGLWLDTQTKAQRGDRLARQAEGGTSQVEAASSRDARPPDLAGHLERITDAMSELAASPQPDLRQLVAWQQALQDLVAWGETPPGRLPDPVMSVARFLAQSLDDPAASAAVARSPSTTLLCLDLFGSLL